jgi:hypothetical protein
MSNGKQSHLVAAGDTREGTGLLCTDSSGLLLDSEGVLAENADKAAGIFSNLTRLASLLQAGGGTVPLITIETDESSTVVKSYDGGHTVALTVPVLQQDAVTTATSRQDSREQLAEQPSASPVEGKVVNS